MRGMAAVSGSLALALLLLGCGDNPADSGDTTPPGRIADLKVVAVTENSATVEWTAPGDDGSRGQAALYDFRYAQTDLYVQWQTAAHIDTLPPPRPGGSRETLHLTGLNQAGNYYFAVAAMDKAMNWSEPSNWARANTSDLTPPAQITDLAATVVSHKSVELTWTAPGDNGALGTAAAYELHYGDGPILEAFLERASYYRPEVAPGTAGTAEVLRLDSLEDETTYTFALRTWDDGPNVSPLSNVVTVTTPPDETPPAAVTDLVVAQVTGSSMVLGWTTPGDDGDEDRAFAYDLRFAAVPITPETWATAAPVAHPPSPGTPGSAERVGITGLQPGTLYHFGLRTRDERGNESPLSNIASGVFDPGSDGVWHVLADGSGDAPTIQAAIDLASAGDLILVGPGSYPDPFDFGGKDLVVESTDGAAATILQAKNTSGEAFIHLGPGTTRSACLTGFIITGARGDQAVLVEQGGLTLSQCILKYNDAVALKVAGGTVAVRDNVFDDNGRMLSTPPSWGGAIVVYPSPDAPAEVTIERNVLSDNQGGVGPALVCGGDDVEIIFRHNTVVDNWCSGPAGAVRIAWSIGHAVIEDNLFEGNRAGSDGGAITLWHTDGGRVEVRRNLFVGNVSSSTNPHGNQGMGAAISVGGRAGIIENNTFVKNRDRFTCVGGCVFVQPRSTILPQDWDWDIRRNIIASNIGGGINCIDELDGVRIRDNLFAANGSCPDISSDLAVRLGNVTADPRFCNPAAGNYRVAADSPALALGAGAYLTPGCAGSASSASVWGMSEGKRR